MRVVQATSASRASWGPWLGRAPARRGQGWVGGRVLEDLVRGPEAVIEVRDGEDLRMLAAIVDTGTTRDDTASLQVVAGYPEGVPERAVADLVNLAERVVSSGPRSALDVPLCSATRGWEPVLVERSYQPAYSVWEQIRRAPSPQPSSAPPPGWRWRELGPSDAEAYHRLLLRALGEVPGALVPSTGELRRWLASSRARPEALVCQVDRLMGWVFATAGPAGGVIRSLGRDPQLHAQGFGDVLLSRAIDRLSRREVAQVRVEVAADNQPAVALTGRHGFQTESAAPVLRRQVAG